MLDGAPGNALEAEAPLPVPGVPPADEAVGAVHLGVVLRLEVVRPLVVVTGGGLGGIGSLLTAEASPPGPDRVPPALRALRWRRKLTPLTAILQPPLLGTHMSGGTRYPAWYSSHASATMRQPWPNPFAATFLWEDDIGSAKGGGAARYWERRDWSGDIGMGKEVGALLLYSGGRRSSSGALAAINAGADGHAAMNDEMLHCVTWESCAPLTSLGRGR
jgi:hypothetical protein